MKRLALAVLTLFTAGAARAEAIDQIAEGAPLYVSARPIALIGALQRAGIADLPSVKQLRRQMGGIDPFNPAILAAPGIDVAAPVAASLFEPAGQGKLYHHRIAATLRDPSTFSSFVGAVAASGQLRDLERIDPGSALGKQGVLATAHPAPDVSLVLRQKGDMAVLDALQSIDDKGKAPAPTELLHRYPLQPSKPFSVGRGARKLFAPESAAVVYIDGRRIGGLIAAVQADDVRHAAAWAQPGDRARITAQANAELKKCNVVWDRAPTAFDDVALALAAAPDTIGLTLAWGTQAGAPLGGLKLAPVDDGGLDAQELGRDAAFVMALYAASLAPFDALKHTGPFASADKFSAALKGCEWRAGAALFVRSWPLALGALAAAPPQSAAPLKPVLSGLRTLVVAIRDLSPANHKPRFAVGATFDGAARALIDAALAATPGAQPGTQATLGKRTATVYPFAVDSLGMEVTIGVDPLPGSRFELAVADSEDSLGWAYRSGDAASARPPVLRVAADLVALVKAGEALDWWKPGQGDFWAQLRHVDGEMVSDGDTLRLELHAPLKH